MRKRFLGLFIGGAVAVAPLLLAQPAVLVGSAAAPRLGCNTGRTLCKETLDSEQTFGDGVYVGHDEPALNFYSSRPGSGANLTTTLRLPKDPSHANPGGKSYNFQLHPAFWFGLAMCDTFSYPLVRSDCADASDTNIQPLKRHPGTAFLELQFYPPGWVTWPAGNSCSPTQWCSAVTIFSNAQDPIHGTRLNDSCSNRVAGPEYGNFAFITRDGVPTGPPNPLDATAASFTPNNDTLFMHSGDEISVQMADVPGGDTTGGIQLTLTDTTSGKSGFMVASAANHFGHIAYTANPSTQCTEVDYSFHPEYSTSSPKTATPWAAESGNMSFVDETGHFDTCSNVTVEADFTQGCKGQEESGTEGWDADDNYCFKAPSVPFVSIAGCQDTNTGFDGYPYHAVNWPDGTNQHPEPITFDAPRTGGFNYDSVSFETDLPRIQAPDSGGQCDRTTGAKCYLIPHTDDGSPADFYPYFTTVNAANQPCRWQFGRSLPGVTTVDFGKNAQYGTLLKTTYLVPGGHGKTQDLYNSFRQVLNGNPCQS